MLEIQESSVIYQAKTKLLSLAYEVASTRNYKKPEAQAKIDQGFRIYKSLQALSYGTYLSRTQREKIWYALIEQAGINDLPIAPTFTATTPPAIQVGIPGVPGLPGPRGADASATDFAVLNTGTDSVIDSFAVADAIAARWDYILYDASGNRRSGTIICDWALDGSVVSPPAEYSTSGSGTTESITFSVDFSAGLIRLLATITSGIWTIKGSRYFIPNNGTGTGIINTSLASGQIFVGNSLNVAVGVTPSGDASLSTSGVLTLTPGVIVNATISGTAAIAFSKMAALTANQVAITDGSGVITTTGSVTLTELSYLSGATSNIQTQLNSKIGSATGAISTVVSSNLTADKVLVSNPSGKIAVGAPSTTEIGFIVGTTASLNDSLISYTTTGITFQNTGAAGANFGAKITSRNTVKIAGILTLAAAGGYTVGATYATLPAGKRPSYAIVKPIIVTQVAGSDMRLSVHINTDGTVSIGSGLDTLSGGVCSAHFDGLEFDL